MKNNKLTLINTIVSMHILFCSSCFGKTNNTTYFHQYLNAPSDTTNTNQYYKKANLVSELYKYCDWVDAEVIGNDFHHLYEVDETQTTLIKLVKKNLSLYKQQVAETFLTIFETGKSLKGRCIYYKFIGKQSKKELFSISFSAKEIEELFEKKNKKQNSQVIK